jgi:hypothetical protein
VRAACRSGSFRGLAVKSVLKSESILKVIDTGIYGSRSMTLTE